MTAANRSAPGWIVSVVGEGNAEEAITDQSHRILSVEYTDAERKVDKLVLTVDNKDLSNFDDQVWKHGNKVRIAWGYPGRMSPTRECVITKVNGFLNLRIEAKALSVLMNRVTKRRTFERMKRSDVVRQIAEENGYGDALDIEDTEVVMEILTQANLTDAQFIKRMAHQEGFEFYVDFDGFHFHERRLGQAPARLYTYFVDKNGGDILDLQLTNDITAKPGRVRVCNRDPLTRQKIEEVADNDTDTDRDVLAPIVLLNEAEGTVGPVLTASEARFLQNTSVAADVEVVRSLAAERTRLGLQGAQAEQFSAAVLEAVAERRAEVANAQEGGARDASETTRPTTQTSSAAARRRARGRFRNVQRTAAEITLMVLGDANVLAKSVIQLAGVGQRLSGLYYVKEVTHTLGSNGYTMRLSLLADGHRGYRRRPRRLPNSGLPETSRRRARGQVNNQDARRRLAETAAQLERAGDTEGAAALLARVNDPAPLSVEEGRQIESNISNETVLVPQTDGTVVTQRRVQYVDRRGRNSQTGSGGQGSGEGG